MPIYEYKYNSCGNCFEQIVFPSDDEGSFACSMCGEKNIKRTLSSFSCVSADGASAGSSCSSGRGFS
ncbi:FmdB family zinc ribbon protein [Thermodesulfobacteriota bacterium]